MSSFQVVVVFKNQLWQLVCYRHLDLTRLLAISFH
jgi:hypothetical protein